MTLHSSNRNSYIISHHLSTNHSQSLTLCRVYFSRHDRRTWFVFWNKNLSNSRTRTRSQHSDIISDFVKRNSQLFQSTVSLYNSIVSSQSLEFVWSCYEWMSCEFSDIFCYFHIITLRSVKSCSNSSSS